MASILKTDQIREYTPNNGIVLGNQIKVQDGTVNNPSIAFNSDPNTGLYRISEDRIGIAAGGQRAGEVGIGWGGFIGNSVQTRFSTSSVGITTADSFLLNTEFTPRLTNSLIVIFGHVYTSSVTGANDHRNHGIWQTSPISTQLVNVEIFLGQAGASTTRSGGAMMALVQNTSLTTRIFALRITHASSGTLGTGGTYNLLIQEIAL
jgi:hypothetical protein